MLLKETKKVQRKYGLSTHGSYVVQLVSEMNDMDAEFVVLTEGSEQTGELLTEAIGLLLLFGAAMAAMYFGSGAIKSIFNQGSPVSKIVTNQKEQQSLTNFVKEKIGKTGDKNQALKELKEKLEKAGEYSEEQIEEILKAFLGGFEDAEEESSDEFESVAKAWAILKDDKASEEDKAKAKEYIEKIAGTNKGEPTKVETKEDLIDYLEKIVELSAGEELQGLNQGGAEGTYEDFLDKNKEILEALQSLEEGDEESTGTLQNDLEEYLQLYDELEDEFKAFFKENGVNKLELGEGLKDVEWLSTPTAEEGPQKFTSIEEMGKYKRDKFSDDEIEEKLKNGIDKEDEAFQSYIDAQENLFDYIDDFQDADDDVAEDDLPDNTTEEEEEDSNLPESYSWGKGTHLLNLLFEGEDTPAPSEQESTFLTYLEDHNAAFEALNGKNKEVWKSVGFGEFTVDEEAFENIIGWNDKEGSNATESGESADEEIGEIVDDIESIDPSEADVDLVSNMLSGIIEEVEVDNSELAAQLSKVKISEKSWKENVGNLNSLLTNADLEIDVQKGIISKLEKAMEELEDNTRLSNDKRRNINEFYSFIRNYIVAAKDTAADPFKMRKNLDKWPADWNEVDNSLKGKFKQTISKDDVKSSIEDYLGGSLKLSSKKKANESHKKQDQVIIERWNKLAGLK